MLLLYPTRQGSSIVRRIRTWRREDDLVWARMKVFRTSFYVPMSVERNLYVRNGRDVDATSFLRPRRIRTSGKLSYGLNSERPLNVRGRLAEWVASRYIYDWYSCKNNINNKQVSKGLSLNKLNHIRLSSIFYPRQDNTHINPIHLLTNSNVILYPRFNIIFHQPWNSIIMFPFHCYTLDVLLLYISLGILSWCFAVRSEVKGTRDQVNHDPSQPWLNGEVIPRHVFRGFSLILSRTELLFPGSERWALFNVVTRSHLDTISRSLIKFILYKQHDGHCIILTSIRRCDVKRHP